MANVKRYNLEAQYDAYVPPHMSEETDGDYVMHVDYVAREAELVGRIERLRLAMRALVEACPICEPCRKGKMQRENCPYSKALFKVQAMLEGDDAASGGEVAP